MTGAGGWNEMLELAAAVCDGTATDADRVRLETLLATSPDLWPSYLRYMHVHASLGDRFRRPFSDPRREPALARRRGLSRRDLFGFGAGLAAGVGLGAALLTREWTKEAAFLTGPIRTALLQATGRVWVGSALVVNSVKLQPGDTITVEGHDSSATIAYSDGTSVTLTNDSVVTFGTTGRRFRLKQGTLTAGVPSRMADAQSVFLETTEVTLELVSGVVTTLGRAIAAATTQIDVHAGRVSVTSAAGAALGSLSGGQMMTVRSDGRPTTVASPTTVERFSWDLTKPLPVGWSVGRREAGQDGPVVVPEEWFDPYHQTKMFQIRSDHIWSWGFRLHPGSTFRVRYMVDKPGPSQLCVCVREDTLPNADTSMIECNGAFAASRPKEWQWLEVKVSDMLGNPSAPKSWRTWVGFLVIFNTYKIDLGLKIAEFHVLPPAKPAGKG